MYSKKIIQHNVIMVDPLPSKEELKSYYENQYYQTADGKNTTYDDVYTEEEIKHKYLEAEIAIEALKVKFEPKTTNLSLVEFGCGEGFFLEQAAQCGWQVRGVDFSKYGIEKWHPQLLDQCEVGDSYVFIENYRKNNEKFDICVLRNVLEHVLDPNFLLAELKKILKPGGILLITVPNDFSDLQKLATSLGHIDQEFWFSPPDHLYYFNTKNIIPFMDDQALKVVDMYSSFPVDFFLFHPGSNYIKDKTNGKAAHFARIYLDLLISAAGISQMLELYRALAKCGIGRDFTVLLRT